MGTLMSVAFIYHRELAFKTTVCGIKFIVISTVLFNYGVRKNTVIYQTSESNYSEWLRRPIWRFHSVLQSKQFHGHLNVDPTSWIINSIYIQNCMYDIGFVAVSSLCIQICRGYWSITQLCSSLTRHSSKIKTSPLLTVHTWCEWSSDYKVPANFLDGQLANLNWRRLWDL